MKQNNLWRVVLILFVVAWSFYELYPPTSRPLIEEFKSRASNTDTNFNQIVQQAEALQQQFPNREFGNLLTAITNNGGTNSLARYFPTIPVPPGQEPVRAVLNAIQHDAAGKIKLGLDLQGGMSFLVGLDTNKLINPDIDKEHVLAEAVEVLRRRVDRLGVAEPLLQPVGENRILIQLPGLAEEERESAKRQIERAAFLEFRMVHPDNDELLKEDSIPPGYELLFEKAKERSGRVTQIPFLVKKRAERGLTGKYVKRAIVVRNPVSGQPEIDFELNNEGADIFAKITKEYSPRGGKYYYLGIVLDGQLYSAPRILGEIPGGRAQITGAFELKEAIELANVLQNPLEAPVKIEEERTVDPSLGRDSIKSGVIASIVGTIAVSLFMLAYYLLAGLVANIALITNVLILMGVMASVGTTLTLPGIAGIVLTVGMAVDANVLIYERLREELNKGKSLRGAIAAGYDRAFGTIFDSHVTTLISSIILIYMGTGPIKGFGVTLTIGVAASLFTALIVTRVIFDWLLNRNLIKTLPMLHFIRATNIDFMKFAKPAFIASWLLILVGLAYGISRGKEALGVDFLGGDTATLGFKQKPDVEAVRRALTGAQIGEALIQYQKDLAGGRETLRVTTAMGTGEKVKATLIKEFPNAGFEQLALDRVGATVGKEIQRTALVACLLSLFGILVYVAFRYEFSFALGAVLAVIHDVFMTIGVYCLAGREFNATTVAAILTIIGFSINDTIVIFDRIREDLKLGVRGTFKELINRALNQTLSRTIITSGTVFLATMSLYLFGGGVINDFAFTFLVGIITGTYSSMYIASALVLWWHKGERPRTAPVPTISSTTAATARA